VYIEALTAYESARVNTAASRTAEILTAQRVKIARVRRGGRGAGEVSGAVSISGIIYHALLAVEIAPGKKYRSS
jgi:hypothetical protein